MPEPAFRRAPEMLVLINRINSTLTAQGVTREQFRDALNQILAPARQLKGHSGLVQVTRWLDPTSSRWAEPKGEVALAMQKWVDREGLY